MPKQSCIIDQSNCTISLVKTRSKKKLKLFFCKNCDFEFFLHNPKKNLAKNKLDIFEDSDLKESLKLALDFNLKRNS